MNEEKVSITINNEEVEGILRIPEEAKGIVLFVHGSGSSRFSPRNSYVANALWGNGIATLLFDLLTEEEDLIYENRFDIDLLAERLVWVTQWVKQQPQTKGLDIGYFGASTGSAAAIQAGAKLGEQIKAIVSRGGRPDLAAKDLDKVKAPTLLIVGGADWQVIELNRKAYKKIKAHKTMKIIPRATHLFEEPGALEEVARLAADWFDFHLGV